MFIFIGTCYSQLQSEKTVITINGTVYRDWSLFNVQKLGDSWSCSVLNKIFILTPLKLKEHNRIIGTRNQEQEGKD